MVARSLCLSLMMYRIALSSNVKTSHVLDMTTSFSSIQNILGLTYGKALSVWQQVYRPAHYNYLWLTDRCQHRTLGWRESHALRRRRRYFLPNSDSRWQGFSSHLPRLRQVLPGHARSVHTADLNSTPCLQKVACTFASL